MYGILLWQEKIRSHFRQHPQHCLYLKNGNFPDTQISSNQNDQFNSLVSLDEKAAFISHITGCVLTNNQDAIARINLLFQNKIPETDNSNIHDNEHQISEKMNQNNNESTTQVLELSDDMSPNQFDNFDEYDCDYEELPVLNTVEFLKKNC
jgi:hypothetical protein